MFASVGGLAVQREWFVPILENIQPYGLPSPCVNPRGRFKLITDTAVTSIPGGNGEFQVSMSRW